MSRGWRPTAGQWGGGYEEFPQEVTFSQTRGRVFGEVEGTE